MVDETSPTPPPRLGLAPLMYADGVSGIQLGVFTSKLIFALQGQIGDQTHPTLTVALPTGALLEFAHELLREMGKPEHVAQFETNMQRFLGALRENAERQHEAESKQKPSRSTSTTRR